MTEFNLYQTTLRQRHRALVDKLTRVYVKAGGFAVIVVISLIFAFLLSVVLPIFKSPSVEQLNTYTRPELAQGQTRFLALSESGELAVRVSSEGKTQFFLTDSGLVIGEFASPLPAPIQRVMPINAEETLLALVDEQQNLLITQATVVVAFDEAGKRQLKAELSYPYGESPLSLSQVLDPSLLSIKRDDDGVALVYVNKSAQIKMDFYAVEEGEPLTDITYEYSWDSPIQPDFLLMNNSAEQIMALSKDGSAMVIDVRDKEEPDVLSKQQLLSPGLNLLRADFLAGGKALITLDSNKQLIQWTVQRTPANSVALAEIRRFETQGQPALLKVEARRKGLLLLNDQQELSLFHMTGGKQLLKTEALFEKMAHWALSARADDLLVELQAGQFALFHIDNEHPEVTWTGLWQQVWYEGYAKPDYIWQSSSSADDFEPKFSLVPLAFGTLKAAFYAMLVSIPISIMGAIYTGYFMMPLMRTWVKPTIEVMGVLPTVILGFLAGLWLAPLVEANLVAVFGLLLVVPAGFLLFALLWQLLPRRLRGGVPAGWEAVLLMPVLILLVWAVFTTGPFIEMAFLGGNTQTWLQTNFGIDYDQRNALVVGIAMGIAVIPTIFSISEDAIYSVPRHLTEGSLALGATPWQTLTKVVILTASPGIFSAVMIGLGRAIGETMIVLMATGNTPVIDLSVFQGMRTLSANIAVEMPESEVDSSHYRILFLAALVLFGVTFVFNTVAEMIRQSLRNRYSNL